MDALTVEGLPWSEIAGAVEAEYSRYFGLTLDFVKIAAENWPKLLAERNLADPVARARALILAEGERLAKAPKDPVIVAGSLGSVPATARLIAAVAALPRGAVVLPGSTSISMPPAGTGSRPARASPHHRPRPPAGDPAPAARAGRPRDEPRRHRAAGHPGSGAERRARLLSQALRPADTTDAWSTLDAGEREATARLGLDGLAVVEAADEREEALVAAIALRETLETPGATAFLVTRIGGSPAGSPSNCCAGDRGRGFRRAGARRRPRGSARPARGRVRRRPAACPGGCDPRPARRPAVAPDGPPRPVAGGAGARRRRPGDRPAAGPRPGPDPREAARRPRRPAGGEDPDRRVPRAEQRLKDVDWDLAARILDALETAFADFPGRREGRPATSSPPPQGTASPARP